MLARTALRIATIEALKGKTAVGGNVLDSQIGAIDVAADGSIRTDQEKPFISVYVDGSKIEGNLTSRALHLSGETLLTIESGVTASMLVTNEEGESEVITGLPATDQNFEFYLDQVGRQIVNALSDPEDVWAEVWRDLTTSVLAIERRRASSDPDKGVRMAAHQLVITVDLLPDPVFGEPIKPTSVWAKLFTRMEADDHPYLGVMRALAGDPADVLDNEAQRRRFGLTLDESRALLDIAVQPGEPTEPDLTSVTSGLQLP